MISDDFQKKQISNRHKFWINFITVLIVKMFHISALNFVLAIVGARKNRVF